jgi:hypothetical protein
MEGDLTPDEIEVVDRAARAATGTGMDPAQLLAGQHVELLVS